MKSYEFLAPLYDRLTADVDYFAFADYYESLITGKGPRPQIVLDLACGTGSLSRILANRGYSVIGVDASPEMLAQAREKSGDDILYLQQALTELDLYGTIDAAICSLDSLNYLPPEEVREAVRRVFLFLNPGGVFAFDLNTPEKLMGQEGEIYCDEDEEGTFLCLWRCHFDPEERACYYDFDLFRQSTASLWERQRETHVEYAHTIEEIQAILEEVGFVDMEVTGNQSKKPPTEGEERIFIAATRPRERTG